MILQLEVSQGQGWLDDDIKSDLKQGISSPKNMAAFYHQIKKFQGASAFFFSDHSMTVKKLSNLQGHMTMNLLYYEAA